LKRTESFMLDTVSPCSAQHCACSRSAQTEYGKIRSDFPVYLSEDDNKDIQIEMGKGTIPVTIKTSKDITIRRE